MFGFVARHASTLLTLPSERADDGSTTVESATNEPQFTRAVLYDQLDEPVLDLVTEEELEEDDEEYEYEEVDEDEEYEEEEEGEEEEYEEEEEEEDGEYAEEDLEEYDEDEEYEEEEEEEEERSTRKKKRKTTTKRPRSVTVPKVNWKLPANTLLKKSEKREVDTRMVKQGGDVLEATMREFGVDARLIDATVGPTVTRYELELAAGVKVSKVTSLSKEIAYAMASHDVRILAPIPGRSAIGVEVPNKMRPIVTLGDILTSPEAKKAKHPLEVSMGRDIAGRAVFNAISESTLWRRRPRR